MGKVKVGDKIKILNRDGQYSKWANKIWIVDHIATSEKDHPGFDEMAGEQLISARGLPVSLYEWEVRKVNYKPKKK